MLTKTEAIILNKIKYSDNTYIISLFTREFGRIAAFVRMNNKSKIDQKPAIFFPLNIIDTEINFKNTSELQNLKFCENKYILTNLFTDIVKIAISQFVAEIIIKTIKEQCANKVLFEYIEEFILKLNNKKEKYSDFHIFFLRDFAAIEGFEIYNNFSE